MASLRAEPESGSQVSSEAIERNRLLIAALDWISLEICWGVKKEISILGVPTVGEYTVELSLHPRGDGHHLILHPWPFQGESLAVRAEGKRLHGRFSTQEELLRALDAAEPVRVTATLHIEFPKKSRSVFRDML